jgi:hypothetical protein
MYDKHDNDDLDNDYYVDSVSLPDLMKEITGRHYIPEEKIEYGIDREDKG